MKKKNILFSLLAGAVSLSTLVSCGNKKDIKNNDKTTTNEVTSDDTSTSTNTNTQTSTSTQTNTTTSEVDNKVEVTKDEFLEEVNDFEDHPQEMGYTQAQVQYSITKDGSTSTGTWSYTFDPEEGKWIGEDDDAKEAQDENFILNYSVTSRIGNPFANLTFYVNPYAIYEESTMSESTAYFEWDEEGKIVTFEANGWFWGDTATFTYSWSK